MKELSLHIMDIMQNSITAECTVLCVAVRMEKHDQVMQIQISDNGCGMDENTLRNAADPFHTSRTTRSVGLGIPMFKEAAAMTGGDFMLESRTGTGTRITADFVNCSIDRQPLGNLGNVFMLNMLSYPDIEFRLELVSSRGRDEFSSREFAAGIRAAGGSEMDAAFEAEEYINTHVKDIFEGILPELGGELHTWNSEK